MNFGSWSIRRDFIVANVRELRLFRIYFANLKLLGRLLRSVDASICLTVSPTKFLMLLSKKRPAWKDLTRYKIFVFFVVSCVFPLGFDAYGTNVSEKIEAVRRAVNLGFYNDALRRLEDLNEDERDTPEVRLMHARALLGQGKLAQASVVIKEGVFDALSPEDAELASRVAGLLQDGGQFRESLKLFERLCDLPGEFSSKARISAALARIALGQSSVKEELNNLRTMQLDPESEKVLIFLDYDNSDEATKRELLPKIQKLAGDAISSHSVLAQIILIEANGVNNLTEESNDFIRSVFRDPAQPRHIRLRATELLVKIELNRGKFDALRDLLETGLKLCTTPAEVLRLMNSLTSTNASNAQWISDCVLGLEKIFTEHRRDLRAAFETAVAELFLLNQNPELAVQRLCLAAALTDNVELQDSLFWRALVASPSSDFFLKTILNTANELGSKPGQWLFWEVSARLLAEETITEQLMDQINSRRNVDDTRWSQLALQISTPSQTILSEFLGSDNLPDQLRKVFLLLHLLRNTTDDSPIINEAITIEPLIGDQNATFFLIRELLTRGRAVAARQLLESVPTAQRGDLWDFYSAEAMLHLSQTRRTELLGMYTRLADTAETGTIRQRARARIAEIHWNEGKVAQARQTWKDLLREELMPEAKAKITFLCALAAAKLGDENEAVTLLSSLTTNDKNDIPEALRCEANLELGRLLIASPDQQKQQKGLSLLKALGTEEINCTTLARALAVMIVVESGLETDEDNLALIEAILQLSAVPADLLQRALIQRGLSLQRLGRDEDAERSFLDVVYRRFPGAVNTAEVTDLYWFGRAVLEAGALMEKRQAWSEAVALYRLAEQTILPESDFWRQRRSRIEREHLVFD